MGKGSEGGGFEGPVALKYLLSNEKKTWKEGWREGGKRRAGLKKPSDKGQVGVM